MPFFAIFSNIRRSSQEKNQSYRTAFQEKSKVSIPKIRVSVQVLRDQAGLFQGKGFSTFLDGISGNWVLEMRETGLDTPTVPRLS